MKKKIFFIFIIIVLLLIPVGVSYSFSGDIAKTTFTLQNSVEINQFESLVLFGSSTLLAINEQLDHIYFDITMSSSNFKDGTFGHVSVKVPNNSEFKGNFSNDSSLGGSFYSTDDNSSIIFYLYQNNNLGGFGDSLTSLVYSMTALNMAVIGIESEPVCDVGNVTIYKSYLNKSNKFEKVYFAKPINTNSDEHNEMLVFVSKNLNTIKIMAETYEIRS